MIDKREQANMKLKTEIAQYKRLLNLLTAKLEDTFCEVGSLKRDLNQIKHLVDKQKEEQQWIQSQLATKLISKEPTVSVQEQLRLKDDHNNQLLANLTKNYEDRIQQIEESHDV